MKDSKKQKIKETCLERYGVNYPQQNADIREKTKATFQKKYGGYTLESNELIKKICY